MPSNLGLELITDLCGKVLSAAYGIRDATEIRLIGRGARLHSKRESQIDEVFGSVRFQIHCALMLRRNFDYNEGDPKPAQLARFAGLWLNRIMFHPMTENMRAQAEQAIGLVVEGTCPLCKVHLRIHDDRACCPCCGDSYKTASHRLEIRRCAEHGRDCDHWDAVWRAKRSE